MLKHPRTVRMDETHDANRAVEEVAADGEPRILVRNGEKVAVIVSPREYAELRGESAEDIWAGYDPERAREALRKATGMFATIDTEELWRDVKAARGQDSIGRPGD